MPSDRRRDAATATVGAAGLAAGGVGRDRVVRSLPKEPRFHAPGVLRTGTRRQKQAYLAASLLGLASAPALAVGSTRLLTGGKEGFVKAGWKAYYPVPPGARKIPSGKLTREVNDTGGWSASSHLKTPRGKTVSSLTHTGELGDYQSRRTIGTVNTVPGFRRRGLAERNLRLEQERIGKPIHHSDNRSDLGEAFARGTGKKLGGEVPPRRYSEDIPARFRGMRISRRTAESPSGIVLQRKPGRVTKRERSFLNEGLRGSAEALTDRAHGALEPVPKEVRAAQLGVAAGAGLGGSALTRMAMRGRTKKLRPGVAPVAGALAATASVPVTNAIIRDRGYVATANGVQRAKKPIRRPSSKATLDRPTPRSFREDLAKRMSDEDYELHSQSLSEDIGQLYKADEDGDTKRRAYWAKQLLAAIDQYTDEGEYDLSDDACEALASTMSAAWYRKNVYPIKGSRRLIDDGPGVDQYKRDHLGRFSKSYFNGRWVKATDLNNRQRNALRAQIAPRREGEGEFDYAMRRRQLASPRNATEAKGKKIWPGVTSPRDGKIRVTRMDSVMARRTQPGTQVNAAALEDGSGGGRIFVRRDKADDPSTMTHEAAHLSPRRNPARLQQRMASPWSQGAEEGRADALAGRPRGGYPNPHKENWDGTPNDVDGPAWQAGYDAVHQTVTRGQRKRAGLGDPVLQDRARARAERARQRGGIRKADDRKTYLGARTPHMTQRAAVTAAGHPPFIGPITQAAAAGRFAPPGQERKHAGRQYALGSGLGVLTGAAGAYGGAHLAASRPGFERRAEAGLRRVEGWENKARGWVGMKAKERDFSAPPKGRFANSRAGKPLFGSKSRAVGATAGFFGVKALTGALGGQTAITLNQRDQKRYNREHGIVAKATPTKEERKGLANKKRVSAYLSGTGGVLGIGGGVQFLRGKKNSALGLSTLSGFTGGANALLNVPIQRGEAKTLDPVKKLEHLAKAGWVGRTDGPPSRLARARFQASTKGVVERVRPKPAQSFKRKGFLHPKAPDYDSSRAMGAFGAKHAETFTSERPGDQLRAVSRIPAGPQAPQKLRDQLSGGSYEETMSRLGRATRHQKKEFSAVVSPLSGKIHDMRRGQKGSVSDATANYLASRKSSQRMGDLWERSKNPEVKARIERNLARKNKNITGPSPVVVHNHPPYGKPGERAHHSSPDLTAQVGRTKDINQRWAVISRANNGRGGKNTRVIESRVVDPKKAGRWLPKVRSVDSATVNERLLRGVGLNDSDVASNVEHARQTADTLKNTPMYRSTLAGGGRHAKVRGYDDYVRRSGTEGSKKSGIRIKETYYKRDGLQITLKPEEHKRLVSRYGDRGPLPKGLPREEKMRAYEARYVHHGGDKADVWGRRAERAEVARNVGLGTATLGGAAYLAARTKRGAKVAAKLHPQARRKADNLAIAGGVGAGGAELFAEHARSRRASYTNSPAGVAGSALRRMRDYTP